uniref:Uncharacterized protein n=1 Tax=Oryza barthii TaxID=65489 RepID=A0A0D3FT00_9ORYZ
MRHLRRAPRLRRIQSIAHHRHNDKSSYPTLSPKRRRCLLHSASVLLASSLLPGSLRGAAPPSSPCFAPPLLLLASSLLPAWRTPPSSPSAAAQTPPSYPSRGGSPNHDNAAVAPLNAAAPSVIIRTSAAVVTAISILVVQGFHQCRYPVSPWLCILPPASQLRRRPAIGASLVQGSAGDATPSSHGGQAFRRH